MAVTIVDIAKRLDISHATVSRVLDGRNTHLISAETQRRVLKVAQEMGYHPNRMARALSTGKSHLIAVSLPDFSAPFFGRFLRTVQRCMKQDGFDLIPFENARSVNLSGWPVDGAIAFGAMAGVGTFIEECREMKIPLVNVASGDSHSTDLVTIDLYKASHDAVKHLLENGRKRVVFLASALDNNIVHSRLKAYEDAMADAGLQPEIVEVTELDKTSAHKRTIEYVNEAGCPDGIFCMNDDFAIAALRALNDLGKRVPEDIRLVGCDGTEETWFTTPRISTIVQPVEEMCVQGWAFLRNRMNEPDLPCQIVELESRLEIRDSSMISNDH